MSENQEPVWQPKTKAEISAEELARMEMEHKKQQSDHRAALSDYQIEHNDEIIEEDNSIIQPSRTRAEISAEELARMEIEHTRYPGEDENIVEEKSTIPQSKNKTVEYPMKEGMLDSLETLLPKEKVSVEKKEEIKKEDQEEKEARIERAIENLRAQDSHLEKISANKQKLNSNFVSKFIGWVKYDDVKINEEYGIVYKEYVKAMEDVQSLTGKTEEQIVEEYLNSKEGKEKPVEAVNEKLDKVEEKLEKNEQGLIGEAKSLYENFKKLSKADQAKIVVGVALVGGAIAVTGAGLGAGVAGMGLMQALNLPTLITLPNMGAYIAYEGVLTLSVAGGSISLLNRFVEKIKKAPAKEKQEVKSENPQEKTIIETPESPEINEDKEKSVAGSLGTVIKDAAMENGNPKGGIEDFLSWIEPDFKKFNDLKSLYEEIDRIKMIDNISSVEIKNRIDNLRRMNKEDLKEKDYESIPELEGLRDKVKELIEKNVLGVHEIKK